MKATRIASDDKERGRGGLHPELGDLFDYSQPLEVINNNWDKGLKYLAFTDSETCLNFLSIATNFKHD